MTYELGRALLLSDAVSPDALANALFTASTEHVSLVRALLATRAIDPQRLEQELARVDAPILRHVTPVFSLMEQLPAGLCARLVAVPVRRDPRTGTIDVAVADARDPHAAEEISFFLGAPVRLVRAPLAAIEAALGRPHTPAGPGGVRALAPPMATPPPAPVRQIASTPLWGTPIAGAGSAAEAHDEDDEEQEEDDDPSAPAMALVADIPIPLSRKVFYSEEIGAASQDTGIAEAIANAFPAITAEPARAMPAVAEAKPAHALDAAWDDDEDDDLGESDEDGQPILELRTKPPSDVAPQRAPAFQAPAFQASTTLNEPPITGILREIAHTTARDELLELLLLGARTTTRKAALFIVKKDGFVGWSCTSDFGDRDALRKLKIDPRGPSFLARAAASGSYAGAVLPNDANAPLLELLEASQETDGEIAVSCVAIKAGGRPAILLVAHELFDPLAANGTLAEIAQLAGEALERIVLTKR